MNQPALHQVYVWDLLVRVCHWVIVLALVALSVSGILIAHPVLVAPGEAGQRFVMGWMRQIHFLSAIAFSLAVAARLVWMLAGGPNARWRNFVPTSRERAVGIVRMMRFYAWPRGHIPFHGAGHNPLAGLSYFAFYAIALGLVLTGFALYSVDASPRSPLQLFAWLVPLFGGAQAARWIHHVLMWPALLFALIHVYVAVFVGHFERNGTVESIVSGFKFIKDDSEHD